MPARAALRSAILDFIERGEGEFTALALALFSYQRAHNVPFGRYCGSLGVGEVSSWAEIPAVATEVYRHAALFCGPLEEAGHVFRTSGTTSGARGQHFLRELGVYHASARRQIDRWLLPWGARPALMLAPPPAALPDSSLSSMLGWIAAERSGEDATFAWSGGQLDVEAALGWLRARSAAGAPVQVLGTSFALVMLLDALEGSLRLPAGSMVMPTGGTKGRTREISAAELEEALVERLGVARSGVVAEYGMTELGSQCYDPRQVEGAGGPSSGGTRLVAPPWCRVVAVDPVRGEVVPPGEEGLLRFVDLANLDSVAAVQTSDLGRVEVADAAGDRFVLFGRAPGAIPRGCSLTLEEAMGDGAAG